MSDRGVLNTKTTPVSRYENYLNNKYGNTDKSFNNTYIANSNTASPTQNYIQKYKEITPVSTQNNLQGYEEIKPVEHEKIKIEGTTDKKLDDEKWIMPCTGRISSPYGWRIHPVYHTKKFHDGIDIAVPEGTPVKAVADGVVHYSGANDPNGYGRYIVITHSVNGKVMTSEYGHLSKLDVIARQKIKKGQIIGKSGNTGASQGPHCHLTIRMGKYKGVSVDPLKYIDFTQ